MIAKLRSMVPKAAPLCARAFAVALVGAWAWTATGDPPAGDATAESLLLLHNGEVVRGEVTRADRHYRVARASGEIRIKAADVEQWCDSLEDAYRYKRDAINPNSIDDLTKLTEWCLRQGLADLAAACLEDAAVVDADHPKLPLLKRRVDLARQPRPAAKYGGQPAAPGPSNAELDQLVRGLPDGAIEAYIRTVQPILLNNCTVGGCHKPGANGLALLRTSGRRGGSRRATQRNLNSVLNLVNRDEPELSRLLTVPMAPHGDSTTAIFTDRRRDQFRQLAAWTRLFASDAARTKHAPSHQSDAPTALPLGNERPEPLPGLDDDSVDAARAEYERDVEASLADTPSSKKEATDDKSPRERRQRQRKNKPGRSGFRMSTGPSKTAEGVPERRVSFEEDIIEEDENSGVSDVEDNDSASEFPVDSLAPPSTEPSSEGARDPFDPDVFNRRYFPE